MAALVLAIVMAACGRPDADVEAAIETRFAGDPGLAPLGLNVSVSRGVAFIGGETQTDEQQAHAMDVAGAVAGVSEAVNEMQIDPDVSIVNAVRNALAGDPLLAAVPIDVDAQNGYVRLMSAATNREQRERAVAIARAIEDVVAVEDRMK